MALGGFLGDLGKAVKGHYREKLRNKYGPPKKRDDSSAPGERSTETGTGGVADIIQGAMRRKRAGKKRS